MKKICRIRIENQVIRFKGDKCEAQKFLPCTSQRYLHLFLRILGEFFSFFIYFLGFRTEKQKNVSKRYENIDYQNKKSLSKKAGGSWENDIWSWKYFVIFESKLKIVLFYF